MKRNSLTMKLRILMIALTLGSAFVLGACVVEMSESDDMTESMLENTDVSSSELMQPTEDEFETEALCPQKWTCTSTIYHSTLSQCTAACGSSPCYRDADCNGSCVCP